MTRRSPPSALRLVPGPAPPRNLPKHTLPSVPRPTFHPPSALAKGPAPRASSRIEAVEMRPEGLRATRRTGNFTRGPWDHSGTISVTIDVDVLIRAPLPVAMGRASM